MKITPASLKSNKTSPATTWTKNAMKVFASTSRKEAWTVGRGAVSTKHVRCLDSEGTPSLWRCFVFRGKTAKQWEKIVTKSNFRLSFLKWEAFFPNHASTQQNIVQTLTTFCYTESRGFSFLDHCIDGILPQRALKYWWKSIQQKTCALFTKLRLEAGYKFRKLSCTHRLEPKMYLNYVTLLSNN